MVPTIEEMKDSLERRGWNRGRSHQASRTIYALVGPANTPEGMREAGRLTKEIANHISLHHLRKMFRGQPIATANKACLLSALFPPAPPTTPNPTPTPTPNPPSSPDQHDPRTDDENDGKKTRDNKDEGERKAAQKSSVVSEDASKRRSTIPNFSGMNPASIPMWSKHSRIVGREKKGFDPRHLTEQDLDSTVVEKARRMFGEYEIDRIADDLANSYLYLLIDPEVLRLADPKGFRSGCPSLEAFVSSIFYVGEGVGNRVHSYEKTADNEYSKEHNTPKIQHILKLRKMGLKKIACLPFKNRTKEEVQDLESAHIYGLVAAGRKFAPKQTLGKNEIANRSRGHYHKTHGWLPHEMLDLSRWLFRQSHEAFLEEFDPESVQVTPSKATKTTRIAAAPKSPKKNASK